MSIFAPYSCSIRYCEHLELQLADHAQDRVLLAARLLEDLHGALFGELLDALLHLLALQRVVQRGRARSARARSAARVSNASASAGRQRVADAEHARVEQADDVARARPRSTVALLRHELLGAWPGGSPCPAGSGCTLMPFTNLPEHTRRNAMRSRCDGSMFAWILKTKPLKRSSVGLRPTAVGSRAGRAAGTAPRTRRGTARRRSSSSRCRRTPA